MKEIRIWWNEEAQELVASGDVELGPSDSSQSDRRLRVVFTSLPDQTDGIQIDWGGYCPFSRVAASAESDPHDADMMPRFTFSDWIGFPDRPHGRFKFTVRIFDCDGEIIAELDPGGDEIPDPPNGDWP